MYLQNHFVINFEPKAVIVYKHAEHFTNQGYTLYSIMILQIRDIYYDFLYRLFVQCNNTVLYTSNVIGKENLLFLFIPVRYWAVWKHIHTHSYII